jgi:hypothetical protein
MSDNTTITLDPDTRERLGHLQLALRRARGGRAVGTSDAVAFLLNALEELPSQVYLRLVAAQFGQTGEKTA